MYSSEAVCLARTFHVFFIQMAWDAKKRNGGMGKEELGKMMFLAAACTFPLLHQ